jgi:hypothetical protein
MKPQVLGIQSRPPNKEHKRRRCLEGATPFPPDCAEWVPPVAFRSRMRFHTGRATSRASAFRRLKFLAVACQRQRIRKYSRG